MGAEDPVGDFSGDTKFLAVEMTLLLSVMFLFELHARLLLEIAQTVGDAPRISICLNCHTLPDGRNV